MSKSNKSPKKRNKKRTFRPNRSAFKQSAAYGDAGNVIGDMMLQSTDVKKNIKTYETPFGKIAVGEGVEMFNFKNKKLLLDILALEDTANEPLSHLAAFEKLKDKYPDEPYVYYEIADAYKRLGEDKKFNEIAQKNYQRFKGNLSIDLDYFDYLYHQAEKSEKSTIREKIFGESLNLHQIYPQNKAFEQQEVLKFYLVTGTALINDKEYQLAKDCAAVLNEIEPKVAQQMEVLIRMKEDATFRWKNYAMIGGLLLLVLTIVGAIIYGIVKFFRWLF